MQCVNIFRQYKLWRLPHPFPHDPTSSCFCCTVILTMVTNRGIKSLLPHQVCFFRAFTRNVNNSNMCVCVCLSVCVLSFPGLERDKFDNKTVTFEEHIKVEHNMWHYLFFIVLVKVKDSTEYTGPESYVAEMIRVRISSFTCPSHFDWSVFLHSTTDFVMQNNKSSI